MSQLTLAGLGTFITAHIPNYPQLKYGTFANVALEELYERLNQIEYGTFTTRAPTTTGTVSATNNSTNLVFSAAVLATTDGMRVIQIGDDAPWYVLTYVGVSQGTLSSVYAGTTDAASTYKIAYPTVSLPAAVGKVLAVHREGFSDLKFAPATDSESYCSAGTTGAPQFFSPYAFDGSATPDDAERLLLKPFPDAMYPHAIQYIKRPTLIDPASATPTTEKIPIPQDFRMALLYGTLALCWSAEDKEGGGWDTKAENALRKAMAYGGTQASGQRRSAYDAAARGSVYQDRPA